MRFVIAGAGDVGLAVCRALLQSGYSVILIEKDPALVQRLYNTLAAYVIQGDVTFFSTLRSVDWTQCEAFLAMTQDDAVNLLSCSLAKTLGAKQTICRIHLELQHELSFFNYQAHLSIDHWINTHHCCALNIAKVLRTNYRVFLEQLSQGSIEIRTLRVGGRSSLIGARIQDLALSQDMRIGLIERNCLYFIPTRDTQVQVGDILTIAGTKDAIGEVARKADPQPSFQYITLYSDNDVTRDLILSLRNPQYKIKVIEKGIERCQSLADRFPHISVIHGDATHLPLLQEEQTQYCDYFVACSDDDEKNIIACLQAKKAGAKHAILWINKEDYAGACDTLGDQLQVDHVVTTQACLWEALHPLLLPQPILSIETLGAESNCPVEILAIQIPSGAHVEGTALQDLHLPPHCVFLVLKHKFYSKVPSAKDTLLGGDCVVAAVLKENRDALIRQLTQKRII